MTRGSPTDTVELRGPSRQRGQGISLGSSSTRAPDSDWLRCPPLGRPARSLCRDPRPAQGKRDRTKKDVSWRRSRGQGPRQTPERSPRRRSPSRAIASGWPRAPPRRRLRVARNVDGGERLRSPHVPCPAARGATPRGQRCWTAPGDTRTSGGAQPTCQIPAAQGPTRASLSRRVHRTELRTPADRRDRSRRGDAPVLHPAHWRRTSTGLSTLANRTRGPSVGASAENNMRMGCRSRDSPFTEVRENRMHRGRRALASTRPRPSDLHGARLGCSLGARKLEAGTEHRSPLRRPSLAPACSSLRFTLRSRRPRRLGHETPKQPTCHPAPELQAMHSQNVRGNGRD
jgi:hypothetical protein